jgi:hypothetical protein
MKKLFLYIDESKDIQNRKLSLLVYIGKGRIWTLNTIYWEIKKKYWISWELHWFRRKEVQFVWKQMIKWNYWEEQKNIEEIHFFEFQNFDERWFMWKNVYEYLTNIIWLQGQIYADKITLSIKDITHLKLQMLRKWFNLEFIHSGNNTSIQIADILCWFCYHTKDAEFLWNISIKRHLYILPNQ